MKPITVFLPPIMTEDSGIQQGSAQLYLPSPYESVESMPEAFFEEWVSRYDPYIQKQIRNYRMANAKN